MPSIKGTASIPSNSALVKQLRSTNFPSNFSQKVNIAKVHRAVFTHWIEKRVEQILGFDDDIVSSTAVHLFLPSNESSSDTTAAAAAAATDFWDVDPRRAQLDLAGFLGENEAATFASELWTMMLDAQTSPSGIPRVLIEKKKEEMRIQREELDRKRKLQQQQYQDAKMRGERGPANRNHHLPNDGGEGNNKNDNDMNAFVREAARRAEAARAAILPAGAGAAGAAGLGGGGGVAAAGLGDRPAPGRDDAAAASAGGNHQPAAIIGENSGPVPVPPSPSPPRYYSGGRFGGNTRGENHDYDRRHHLGDAIGDFSNYDHRRCNGGRSNYDYYNNSRSDYIDDPDVYHRNNDYYLSRTGEKGDFRDRDRRGGRWENLDEFGRGRWNESDGRNNYPDDRDRRLAIGKSGGSDGSAGVTAKGEGRYKDNKLDDQKKAPLRGNKNDKSNKTPSSGRSDTRSGSGIGTNGSSAGKDGGVRPTRHSSRSASRSSSHRSSSRSSSRSLSSRSRSTSSRSYSSSSSGSSSRSRRSRSFSLSRSRSRSESSSQSRRSRDRDERKYKTHPCKGDSGVRRKRSNDRSRSRDRQETAKARIGDVTGTEHSSSSYKDEVSSHGRHRHHHHRHHHHKP